MQLATGTRLGPYEILSRIGAGGMGEVFKARDTRLERSVAIKVLSPAVAADAQLKARFHREARAVSQLNHPNICTLHDVGQENGTTFLVMELLEGETLADRIGRGPLSLAEVLRYGVQIAEALAKAHREGIVHRDLKPANVMLTRTGAKLLDFGLAKIGAPEVVSLDGATEHKPLTREGTILGTFQYMAPEQLEGLEADARTDIFALGCVLYEMAAGERPFQGATKTSLIAAIVSGEPKPISQIQPLTPASLEHVVRKCLEKQPDERWQSAHDVAEQLKWIGDPASRTASVPSANRTRERALWLAGLLALAAFAGWLGWKAARPEAAPEYSFTLPDAEGAYQRIAGLHVSPDGRKVIFGAYDSAGRFFCWVRPLNSLEVVKLDATESVGGLGFWSADSKFVIFYKDGVLSKVSATGGPAQPIASLPRYRNGAMNADGTLLVAMGDAPINRVDPRTGKIEAVTKLDTAAGEFTHTTPSFLPDGKRFLFLANVYASANGDRDYRLYVGNIETGESKYLGTIASGPHYVEPGYLLYVRKGSLLAHPFDLDKMEFSGEPRTLLPDVDFFYIHATGSFGVSKDTLVARATRRPHRIYRIGADGRLGAPLGPAGRFRQLDVSRTGTNIAAGLEDPTTGALNIWSYDMKRDTALRLTTARSWDDSPRWSHDGTHVYFSSDRQGYPDIYRTPADGTGEAELVLREPGVQSPLDVSADGRHLLYSTSDEASRGSDLYLLSLDTRSARPFIKTRFVEGGGRFSPNGRLVSYISDQSGTRQVYVKPVDGGSARQISTTGITSSARWSADSRTLFYIREKQMMSVDVSDTGTPVSEPRPLFDIPQGDYAGTFDVLPDRTFLMTLNTGDSTNPPQTRVIVNWTRLLRD